MVDSGTPPLNGSLPMDNKDRIEAAKAYYQQQVIILGTITRVDMQIITGYLAIQLLVGGWLAKTSPIPSRVQLGLFILEVCLTVSTLSVFWHSRTRRKEISETIRHLNKALGYSSRGAYVAGEMIQEPRKTHFWFPWFCTAVLGGFVGFVVVLTRP